MKIGCFFSVLVETWGKSLPEGVVGSRRCGCETGRKLCDLGSWFRPSSLSCTVSLRSLRVPAINILLDQ